MLAEKKMARWWLYKCEVCGVAVFSNQDHGNAWYNDCCGICKTWTYYDKVVIHENMCLLPGIEDEYMFMCKANQKEEDKNNDNENNSK